MKQIFWLTITSLLLQNTIFAEEPKAFYLADSEFIGSQLNQVLNGMLSEDSALVFKTEDTMKSMFLESTDGARYKRYVYYDRAKLIVGDVGGGFEGDYITRAAEHLGDAIEGFIIPIDGGRAIRSSMTANKILDAYVKEFTRHGDYDVYFLIDVSFANTAFRTSGYEDGKFHFIVSSSVEKREQPERQVKKLKRYQDRIKGDSMIAIDLRNPGELDSKILTEFFDFAGERSSVVIFDANEESILAMADAIDCRKKAQNR